MPLGCVREAIELTRVSAITLQAADAHDPEVTGRGTRAELRREEWPSLRVLVSESAAALGEAGDGPGGEGRLQSVRSLTGAEAPV